MYKLRGVSAEVLVDGHGGGEPVAGCWGFGTRRVGCLPFCSVFGCATVRRSAPPVVALGVALSYVG